MPPPSDESDDEAFPLGIPCRADVDDTPSDTAIEAEASLGPLDRGHGGYLEIAMGMGVAGPAVLLAGALCLAWLLIRGAWMRRSRRFIPAAALGSLLLVLMHSGFDFPMQVTGLAVYAAAVFASGVVQSRPPRVKRSQRPTRSPPAAGAADEH